MSSSASFQSAGSPFEFGVGREKVIIIQVRCIPIVQRQRRGGRFFKGGRRRREMGHNSWEVVGREQGVGEGEVGEDGEKRRGGRVDFGVRRKGRGGGERENRFIRRRVEPFLKEGGEGGRGHR